MKEKRQTFFEWGFEPQIFSDFPAYDLNFHEVREMRSNLGKEVNKIEWLILIYGASSGFGGQGNPCFDNLKIDGI